MIKRILPNSLKLRIKLVLNYICDYMLYAKYSTVFSKETFTKKEAELILQYHGLEKGMLFDPMKPRFAINRINKIIQLLNDDEIKDRVTLSQVFTGYMVAIEYYDLHKKQGIDISDYYTEVNYLNFKKIVSKVNREFNSGKIKLNVKDIYVENQNFYNFANSRKSIRNYSGELIPLNTIEKVIALANTSPSVCNRQGTKVKLVENKKLIEKILEIQGGFTGYIENVHQLLIVTVDRQYFYTIGERNQFYIDGGIYLMNLLYALHFYKIAACPANWGKDIQAEKKLNKYISIPESEKIICMIPIGISVENICVTLSQRRDVNEVLEIVQ